MSRTQSEEEIADLREDATREHDAYDKHVGALFVRNCADSCRTTPDEPFVTDPLITNYIHAMNECRSYEISSQHCVQLFRTSFEFSRAGRLPDEPRHVIKASSLHHISSIPEQP